MTTAHPGTLDLLHQICSIPSEARQERALADALRAELESLGLEVREDDAATVVGGTSGNLIARLPATATGTAIAICAHMDTVPLTAPLEPTVTGGTFHNARAGIIGVDNKAAVAVAIGAVRTIVEQDIPHAGIELVFTVCEEVGLLGAAALDLSALEADSIFVMDHADRIGCLVERAPSQAWIDLRFRGVAAHAGIAPEQGRSAILAAATAVGRMPHGRIDADTTVNVGTITGGSASNVVAAACDVAIEARSMDPARLSATVEAVIQAATDAAAVHGIDCAVDVRDAYVGYRVPGSDPSWQLAGQALERVGLEPTGVPCGGGSDVNVFRAAGRSAVNLCNAMQDIHTAEERIELADLELMERILLEVVAAARVG